MLNSGGAGVRGWHESNFEIGRKGRLGQQNFVAVQKNCRVRNIRVSETYDFMNFYCDYKKFYL